MLPARTLQQLIELAQRHSDNAARALGVTHTRERDEGGKLQLLLDYRRDYQLRFQQAAGAGLNLQEWHNYHEFIRKLDAAIQQQQEVLVQYQRKMAQCRTEWHAANRKLKSYDTLSQRRQQVERTKERKREQREQDELAARNTLRIAPQS